MELINYLNNNFHTKQTLLKLCDISSEELLRLQTQQITPKCSYKIKFSVNCDSFFGDYDNQEVTEYYAKGTVEWLKVVKKSSSEHAFSIFSERYQRQLKQLQKQGFNSIEEKLNGDIAQYLKEEWLHFLNGTYGLCTQSGLPEDIASKELAISEINRLISLNELSTEQRQTLKNVVNLLDQVSALFAPHERLQSSRHRLIAQVREKYQLSN
ncbi:MAG: hypothetical protein HRT52_15220 [Colwellia sp.]|nr:hypothetical protein [Colwellia sp.]